MTPLLSSATVDVQHALANYLLVGFLSLVVASIAFVYIQVRTGGTDKKAGHNIAVIIGVTSLIIGVTSLAMHSPLKDPASPQQFIEVTAEYDIPYKEFNEFLRHSKTLHPKSAPVLFSSDKNEDAVVLVEAKWDEACAAKCGYPNQYTFTPYDTKDEVPARYVTVGQFTG